MRVIEVKEDIFKNNDLEANKLRQELSDLNTYMINVMSSPGSGKTTLLIELINELKKDMRVGLMDVDIESSIDANRVKEATNIPSVQIHNGGLCHIDAFMTSTALKQSELKDIDLLFLENIGNLVCPAEFDTGAHTNMMLLSVPEGDDKPLKYPLMFKISDIIVITKIDTLPAFDFDVSKCMEYIKELNPNAKVIMASAKTGEGIKELVQLIKKLKGEKSCQK